MEADATWDELKSGDATGQAIQESLDARTPSIDPSLREVLQQRLAASSADSKVSRRESPSATAGNWKRWLAICAGLLLLGGGWWGFSPNGPLATYTQLSESGRYSNEELSVKNFEGVPTYLRLSGETLSLAPPNTSAAPQIPVNEPSTNYGTAANSPYLSGNAGLGGMADGGHSIRGAYNSDLGNSSYFEPDSEWDPGQSAEQYNPIYENQFRTARGEEAISTFSIDVDTASYANMRRFLNNGQRPPANAVRIEEMINYFSYDYPQPEGKTPFSVNMEIADCPWNAQHQLLRVGLKGKDIDRNERPVSNLVFLLDVSGSMNDANKLTLLKRGLRMMVDQLNENDMISIVIYAGNTGVVLGPTSGDQKRKIHDAIERLRSGGSTNGSAGIQLAYDLATQNYIEGGVNRVIWATDGDLNVGVTDDRTLINLVSERAQEGVFLTTLGFGTGNLKDGKLEQIANQGNGIYAYIDTIREARKVLIEQMSASLVTIAKDVKLQIEFNPAVVSAYRLIGYENRVLQTEDFDNDAKDAGDIGAGHTVTALYEIVPAGTVSTETPSSKPLKYQTQPQSQSSAPEAAEQQEILSEAAQTGEMLTLALRYKLPDENESTRVEFTLENESRAFDEASTDFRFAASVAGFGMLLRDSKYRGTVTHPMVEEIARTSMGDDTHGYRAEFIDLVRRAK